MMIVFGFVRLVWKLIWSAVVVTVCLSMIFILYKVQKTAEGEHLKRSMSHRLNGASRTP
jgi:hypothetical protein